jgi:hypothetical protein
MMNNILQPKGLVKGQNKVLRFNVKHINGTLLPETQIPESAAPCIDHYHTVRKLKVYRMVLNPGVYSSEVEPNLSHPFSDLETALLDMSA